MLHAGGVLVTILDTVDDRNLGRRLDRDAAAIALDDHYAAHNYSPLPVVAASAEGAWITDVEGRRYLDCLAAYSAVNFGHRNPEIIATAHAQLDAVTLVSRAFHSDRLGPFCAALAELCGKDMVLPMNSGAEAVESGIKVARKWGTDVKGVPADQANIIVAHNNFHGRTTTIISFSDDETARRGFGPYTPGFRAVPFGDADALAAAIDENTVAVLLEPIQGEAGIIVPPDDYLPRVRALCTERNVLMIADEIQSGLARTGTHVRVRPLGRRARRLPPRQGARRRRRPAVGRGGQPRRARRAAPRRARLDVRRQSVGRGDRHHRRRDAAARRIPVPLSRTRRASARPTARADRPRRARRARHGPVGGRRHRPAHRHRKARQLALGRSAVFS